MGVAERIVDLEMMEHLFAPGAEFGYSQCK
jgi:hypothetical protein